MGPISQRRETRIHQRVWFRRRQEREMPQIGRYEILKKAGVRGPNVVYDAFDPVMRRPVTIKFPQSTSNPEAAQRARQEILEDAHQLAQLMHPGIVKILSCEEAGDSPFLVTERFGSRSLETLLAERRKLPSADVAAIVKAAGAALDFAHSKGRLHPNLTLNSLLVDDDLRVKIAGFESSRPPQRIHDEYDRANFSALQGSISYMSPELIKGDAIDALSDQFSLGIIAFEALTGIPPFHSHSAVKLLCRIGFEEPLLHGPLAEFPPGLPAVIGRALAKTPGSRYPSCSDFAAALERALGRGTAPRNAPMSTRVIEASEVSRENWPHAPSAIGPSETRMVSMEQPGGAGLVFRFRWAGIAALVAILALAAWIFFSRQAESVKAPPAVQPNGGR